MTTASTLSELLLKARREGRPILSLPIDDAPASQQEAYDIQDQVAGALASTLGPITGWKVGAPTATGTPFCAPVHNATIFRSGQPIPEGLCRFSGAEAEIAYSFKSDLPSRAEPWTPDEVFAAIDMIHAAIEIIDTRFEKPNCQAPLTHAADQGNHGAMVIGPGVPNWKDFTPVTLPMTMSINGEVAFSHRGGNTAGEPLRLLVWLANHAASRGMPITAGTVVITGSTMGTHFVEPGTRIDVAFEGLPPVDTFVPPRAN